MKMHTCREVTEIASDFLDGEVSWADWATLKLHLAMCPPCKAYVEQLGITIDALRHLPEPAQQVAQDDLSKIFRDWKEGKHADPPPDDGS